MRGASLQYTKLFQARQLVIKNILYDTYEITSLQIHFLEG